MNWLREVAGSEAVLKWWVGWEGVRGRSGWPGVLRTRAIEWVIGDG